MPATLQQQRCRLVTTSRRMRHDPAARDLNLVVNEPQHRSASLAP
jgi:hypothetical protein